MGESTRAIRTNCLAGQIDVITLAFSGRIDNNRARDKGRSKGTENERGRQRHKQQNNKNNAKLTTATPVCLGATPVAQWGIVNFHTTTATDIDTHTDTLTVTDTVTVTLVTRQQIHALTDTDTFCIAMRRKLHSNGCHLNLPISEAATP